MLLPSIQPILAQDIPWVIIAMIFIAFIRWVVDRIRGVNAEDPDLEPARRYEDFVEEDEEDDSYRRQQTGPPPPPLPPRQAQPAGGGAAADELRKFLDQLGGGATKAPAPAVSQKQSPPPVPKPAAKPSLNKAEQDALALVKNQGFGSGISAVRQTRRSSSLGIGSMLRDPDSVRKAVVLKEVLGKPKALEME